MKSIRELRRERGWTHFELALAVEVQSQTNFLWERGRRVPQVLQMRRLGAVFGLCSDEIALAPETEHRLRAPHWARAARRPGEPAPGRARPARSLTRSGEALAAERDLA